MGAIYSFETSVDFQWTTQHYIPEARTLHNHFRKNLKSYNPHYSYQQSEVTYLVFHEEI
jgi:hypothetical protein